MKDVDLGEPTSFPDHVYLVALKEKVRLARILWIINYRSMFESRNSAGAMENYQKQKRRGNLMPKRYLHGPMT